MQVSVVTTLFNERDSVDVLIDSLLAQDRPADEIVIVDAGSTDGTAELLDARAAAHPSLVVLHRPSGRSEGRNIAIEAATHDVIACIDGGCVAESGWLKELLAPFDADPGTTWVAGFYRPEGRTLRSTCIGLVMVYVRDEVDPASFLPSARSMAFHRRAWREVGGFPEGLQFAEDTLFDERLVAAGHHPVFAGGAIVRWTPPPGYRALARTLFRWGRGDGLAGLRGYTYKRILALYGGTALVGAAALAVAPRAAPMSLLPLAALTARETRRKYRWAAGRAKYLHIPLAHLVASASSLTGFCAGYLEARRRPDSVARWRTPS